MKTVDVEKLPAAPYKPLIELSRRVAAEGSVLLKNEGNLLPLTNKQKISVFGRTQINYYKHGIGSGGLVNTEYVVNILDGIRSNPKLTLNEELVSVYESWLADNPVETTPGWYNAPRSQFEMVPDEKTVREAREHSDVAVIVLGRTAGEARDNSAEKGSWYLTDEEEAMIKIVSEHFDKTVALLNTGNIMDMSWVEKYGIKSVLYIWQGGQEGGNAVADLLCGDATPSGKLSDTIARDISLYPGVEHFGSEKENLYIEDIYVGYRYFETFKKDEVIYPFGFGISYTEFEHSVKSAEEKDCIIELDVEVKNIGNFTGREIIEAYFAAPQGKLGKSARELCGFKKTKSLRPGETELLHIEIAVKDMCAYDDSGITGHKSCYVMESGEYNIYVGTNVRDAAKVFTHTEPETVVIKKCTEVMAPVQDFEVMHPEYKDGEYVLTYVPVSKRTVDYNTRVMANLPREITPTGDMGIKLVDVKNGKNTMEEFVAQISDTDLMCLAKGEGMCSPKTRPGSAAAAGGITENLMNFGIPVIALHDGPSGIRMDSGEYATSMPNGTAIACTWDEEIAEELYYGLSVELSTHNIDSILGPGINIHRLPLCGRNFEYLSEDPYLSGKIGVALVRGVGALKNSATVKHFAANSQEYYRLDVDSVMSERALREIYLRSFEYPVKEGKVSSIMTAYNPINGRHCPKNYELNTIVLREEWGYEGFVMTDWWPKLSEDNGECKNLKDMVRAQNDVYMVTNDALTHNDNLSASLENGELTRAELQRNATNLLRIIMNSRAFDRFVKYGGGFQKSLFDSLDTLETEVTVDVPESGTEYEIKVEKAGMHLLCIEYTSEQPSLLQLTVGINIGGKSAASVTVNGTEGEIKTVYRDISLITGNTKVSVNYPEDLINVTKLEIKG